MDSTDLIVVLKEATCFRLHQGKFGLLIKKNFFSESGEILGQTAQGGSGVTFFGWFQEKGEYLTE